MGKYMYLEICSRLRSDIMTGLYSCGQKLPSENQLAAKTGYSRQTVRQAIAILEREGLVERIQGSGTYVRSQTAVRPKSHTVGVITTYISEHIFPAILQGIDTAFSEHGYMPLVFATRNSVKKERSILSELKRTAIDGLLVEGTKTALPNPNLDLYDAIARQGIPIVYMNGYYQGLKNPIYVVTDDREGGRIACRRLIERGHTRIAGFFKSDDIQGLRRYEGYTEALVAAGLHVDDSHVLWYTTETRDLILSNCVSKTLDGCTGAICYNDEIAVRAIQACPDRAVEWVSFDKSAYADMPGSRYFSLGHPKKKLGRLAAEKLLNLLNGRAETPTVLGWDLE